MTRGKAAGPAWSALLEKTLVGGGGPRRVRQGQFSPARRDGLGVSRLKLNERRAADKNYRRLYSQVRQRQTSLAEANWSKISQPQHDVDHARQVRPESTWAETAGRILSVL